jgi:SpoVK/Ycf46/Vps4 family AAA+-type ATPase
MTKNRDTEDLFQELVDNGIIHPYKKQYLKEFKGDFSYSNWEKRNWGFDPPATLGDVRQAVKINCIAPLSTEGMKKPRSTLLVGPRQSGKHLLANAVFTESQSVLFDLSPEILEGKYPGKKVRQGKYEAWSYLTVFVLSRG